MAGQYIPRPDSIGSMFEEMHRRLQALETTPAAGNQSIQGGALAVLSQGGTAETLVGEYEWPTSPWAGNKIYGMVTFGATGHPLVVVGLQPDGKYGMGVYDDTGVRAVFLGDQGSGLYGLGIRNHATGTLQQVGGAISAQGSSVHGVTSSTPAVASGTSVTATLGPGGQALVMISATAVLPSSTVGGSPSGAACAQLFVDGSVVPGGSTGAFAAVESAGTLDVTVSAQLLASPGSGSHTFDIRVWMNGGGSADFLNPFIIVQPL